MNEPTTNTVVAANVARLRRQRGWTQDHLAELLSERDDKPWSISMVSDAERSQRLDRDDKRPSRQFTADEVVALARVFQVSLLNLFLPAKRQRVRIGPSLYTRDDFVDLVLQFPPGAMPNGFEERLHSEYELRNSGTDRLRWASSPNGKISGAGRY